MAKASTHRRSNDTCGAFEVKLEPRAGGASVCDRGGKDAVKFTVTQRHMTVWAPDEPLCVPWDMSTRKGREKAADSAADFFEHYRCGQGALSGARAKNTGVKLILAALGAIGVGSLAFVAIRPAA